jgi:oligosaccharide repeat unit polymerase
MFISILVLAIGSALALFSRRLLGRWFNYLSIYSIAWSLVLAAHEVGIVSYYPIDAVTWAVIVAAAVSFFLGSIAVILVQRGRVSRGGRLVQVPSAEAKVRSSSEALPTQRGVRWGILVLSGISLFGVAQGFLVLRGFWGGLDRILRFGSDVYMTRIANPIEGQVPYLSVTAVAACSLAGLYAARGQFSIICIIPFVLLFLDAFNVMGSATYLLAGILFLSSYLLLQRKHSLKSILLLLLVGASLPSVMQLIRGMRGASEEYGYESQTFVSLSRTVGLTEGMYNYFSVSPGVLNEFLRRPYQSNVPGSLTFGAAFRVLGRFKLTEPLPRYGLVYYTPFAGNVGTYLLPLYADFGMSGILLGPFILGMFCAWRWSRFRLKPTLTQVILISHVYAGVAVSPILNCLGDWGCWGVSLSFGLLMAWAVEARGRSQARRLPSATATARLHGAGPGQQLSSFQRLG